MKQIYKRLPATNQEVTDHVWKLCKEFNIPKPKVRFLYENFPHCQDDGIYLYDVHWFRKHDGPYELKTQAIRYWENVLHELSHWFAFMTGAEEVDHRPEMYSILLGLMLHEGIPLNIVHRGEADYKPGSLRRGGKAAGRVILENFLGRPPVARVTRNGAHATPSTVAASDSSLAGSLGGERLV